MTGPDARFLSAIQACHTARLPGHRRALWAAGEPIGWVEPDIIDLLAGPDTRIAADQVTFRDAEALNRAVGRLRAQGKFHWRDEPFDVHGDASGALVAQVDRGALPLLGLRAQGVHLNGLVRRPNGLHLWVARRADTKLLDPGKLDHLVAGGVSAGMGVVDTLVKEAGEEAGIPAPALREAVKTGVLDYAMDRPEGLRRDRLHCFDLVLAADFVPRPVDGEVAGFELWPIDQVYRTVRDDIDAFKFNVNLVLIDLFLRLGLIAPEAAPQIRAALDSGFSYQNCPS